MKVATIRLHHMYCLYFVTLGTRKKGVASNVLFVNDIVVIYYDSRYSSNNRL
jgi:hypothetical protein